MATVVDAVKSFFDTHADLGSTGVVAVSGGADSVALLRALLELDRFKLIVAHVNHQLRGEESDGDEAFVRDLAATHKLEFVSTRVTIPAGRSVEVTARNLRYEWFAQSAKKSEADWLATGHTANDQAETILHRIIRGTGLHGLSGIPSRSPSKSSGLTSSPPTAVGGLGTIRPLLEVERSGIVDYLKSLPQPHRNDSSNDDCHFTRNRIRHELMPLAKTFNSNVLESLIQLGHQSQMINVVLECLVRRRLSEIERPMAGATVILDWHLLRTEVLLLTGEFFRYIWKRQCWSECDMTHDHWNRLSVLHEGDYPGGIRLKLVGTVVQLGPRS